MNISTLAKAVKKGNELPDSAKWKWSGVVVLLLMAAVQTLNLIGVDVDLTEESIVQLAGIAYAIYIKFATTEKIGL